MLRRYASIFIFLFLIFCSSFVAINVHAADSDLDAKLKEFCDKRTGNQMNLETWYSGKCTDDSMSGEGVGFSDIVLLDIAERVSGKKDPNATFDVILKDLMKTLKDSQASNTLTPEVKYQAIESARDKYFNTPTNTPTGQIAKFMALILNTRPASTYSYVAYVSENLQKHRVIPQALAANTTVSGAGFQTMSVFIPLWKITRNLAYTFMVLIFVVYGLMMMFRINLGQKTVITVQLAIPKLIVTFLAITFSFAIVGLAMDLMWVSFWLILYFLGDQKLILVSHPFVWASTGRGGMFLSWLMNSLVVSASSPVVVTNLLIGGSNAIGTTIGLIGAFTGLGLIVAIIISIAVAIAYFKLFQKLISSFVSLVVSLVTAPLVLLGNVMPGSTAIGKWFRSVLANVMVFPVTMVLLLFSYILIVQPLVGACDQAIFGLPIALDNTNNFNICELFFGVMTIAEPGYVNTIPLITPLSGTIGTGFTPSVLLALIGIVLLFQSSKYVDIITTALKVPPNKYGDDLTAALKEGFGLYKNTAAAANKAVSGKQTSTSSQGTRSTASPTPQPPAANPTPTPPTPPSGQGNPTQTQQWSSDPNADGGLGD